MALVMAVHSFARGRPSLDHFGVVSPLERAAIKTSGWKTIRPNYDYRPPFSQPFLAASPPPLQRFVSPFCFRSKKIFLFGSFFLSGASTPPARLQSGKVGPKGC